MSLPPTYVISMSDARLQQTREELAPHPLTHVPGVRGADHRGDARLTRFGRAFCTDRMVGCALAHHDAARRIVEDGHAVALVLEDDVLVQGDKATLAARVEAVLRAHEGEPSWDIITLFCQGVCNNRSRFWNWSTAAYLISAKGATTLGNIKIGYHADFIRNSMLFNVVVGPNLFSTRDVRSIIPFGNQSLGFWANQDALRIGRSNATVTHALVVWSVLLVLAKRHGKDALLTALLAFPGVVALFMSYETQYYRCSSITHAFGILFPLAVLLVPADAPRPQRLAVTGMAQGMVLFHLMHELDR